MHSYGLTDKAIDVLMTWYDEQRPAPAQHPPRDVVCIGLTLLEHARQLGLPHCADYLSQNSQLRINPGLIYHLLARHGENRPYTQQERHMTPNIHPAAEQLIHKLCALPGARLLVRTSLPLLYPHLTMDIMATHPTHTQSKRLGDFIVGDTVFRVDTSPVPNGDADKNLEALLTQYNRHVVHAESGPALLVEIPKLLL